MKEYNEVGNRNTCRRYKTVPVVWLLFTTFKYLRTKTVNSTSVYITHPSETTSDAIKYIWIEHMYNTCVRIVFRLHKLQQSQFIYDQYLDYLALNCIESTHVSYKIKSVNIRTSIRHKTLSLMGYGIPKKQHYKNIFMLPSFNSVSSVHSKKF